MGKTPLKNPNSLLRTVLEYIIRKIPVGIPSMRWKYVVKNNVEELGGGTKRKM